MTAAGTVLLSAATTADLGTHEGQEATGQAVRVQSVPSDEGFWVGTSEQNRLWVQLSGVRGESDYQVAKDDTVDFTGVVTRTPSGFAADKDVTTQEGGDQLTTRDFHLSVPWSSIRLHS